MVQNMTNQFDVFLIPWGSNIYRIHNTKKNLRPVGMIYLLNIIQETFLINMNWRWICMNVFAIRFNLLCIFCPYGTRMSFSCTFFYKYFVPMGQK